MDLTPAQTTTLGAFIAATPELADQPDTTDGAMAIADAMDAPAVPDFWVYRTSASEADYTTQSGPEGTTWNWQAYMARSQGERDGWGRLFATGTVDPSRANVRQGFDDIFNGTGLAATQRAHLLAVNRRRATVAEKLFATGTGSTAAPATMAVEGKLDADDILAARAV